MLLILILLLQFLKCYRSSSCGDGVGDGDDVVVVGAEEGGRCGDAPTDTDVEDALVSDDDDDDDDMTVKHVWDVTGTFDVSSLKVYQIRYTRL